jgi:hypothetical protein
MSIRAQCMFDYNAQLSNQISFKKGHTIIISGHLGEPGSWSWGEVIESGNSGYFPTDYVKLIEQNFVPPSINTFNQQQQNQQQGYNNNNNNNNNMNNNALQFQSQPLNQQYTTNLLPVVKHNINPPTQSLFAKALFDFTGSNSNEQNLKKDEIVEIITKGTKGGWCIGKFGAFPTDYIEYLLPKQAVQQPIHNPLPQQLIHNPLPQQPIHNPLPQQLIHNPLPQQPLKLYPDLHRVTVGTMVNIIKSALKTGHTGYIPIDNNTVTTANPPFIELGRLEARVSDYYKKITIEFDEIDNPKPKKSRSRSRSLSYDSYEEKDLVPKLEPCYDFRKGICFRSTCRFSHDFSSNENSSNASNSSTTYEHNNEKYMINKFQRSLPSVNPIDIYSGRS